MKKLLIVVLTLVSILSFVGCGSTKSKTTTPAKSSTSTEKSEPKGELVYSKVTSWSDSIGSVWISYVGEYKNTGTEPLYLSASDIDIEDVDGNLIETMSMVSVYPDVIMPGESAFYYNATVTDKALPEGELKSLDHIKSKKATVKQILFPVSDIETTAGSFGGIEVVGRVENNTEKDEGLVTVAALVRDPEGNPLCALMTITDVIAGDKKGFVASTLGLPDNITPEVVGDVTVFAYPVQMQF